MQLALKILVLVAVVYFALVGYLYSQQRKIIFRPDLVEPLGEPLPELFKPFYSTTQEGFRLRHYYRPAQAQEGPVVIFLHGNASSAARETLGNPLNRLPENVGLLYAEYRGYDGLEGQPGEQEIIGDLLGLLRQMRADLAIAPERIFLFGHSLGSGFAVPLAKAMAEEGQPLGGVILEAPFASVRSLAQKHYWFMPIKPLLKDPFLSSDIISEIGSKLLIIHAEDDSVIPYSSGLDLFQAAVEPKQMLSLKEGGHVKLLDIPEAMEAVEAFIGLSDPASLPN